MRFCIEPGAGAAVLAMVAVLGVVLVAEYTIVWSENRVRFGVMTAGSVDDSALDFLNMVCPNRGRFTSWPSSSAVFCRLIAELGA